VVDLFRPFMSDEARKLSNECLTPDQDGRLMVGEGPRAQEFEKAFGSFVGLETPRPLLTNSCTSALDLACHLIGIEDAEVISTPITCTATNGVLVNRKATIVWADVDPITGLISPDDVARKITRHTKAIMAVDWGGRSCDYKALRSHGLPVIQDAAHNILVDPSNHGDYVAWSFQAIKHLTTVDGGALLVPGGQHERARLLRWYGLDRESGSSYRCSQNIQEAGFKYHMSDATASLGLGNLPYVRQNVATQRWHAQWLSHALRLHPIVTLPPDDPKGSWWLYTVLVEDRDDFMAYLAEQGIDSSPVHARNDTHAAFHYPNGPLPGVDSFAAREVAIPIGWWLSQQDLEKIAGSIWAYSRERVAV